MGGVRALPHSESAQLETACIVAGRVGGPAQTDPLRRAEATPQRSRRSAATRRRTSITPEPSPPDGRHRTACAHPAAAVSTVVGHSHTPGGSAPAGRPPSPAPLERTSVLFSALSVPSVFFPPFYFFLLLSSSCQWGGEMRGPTAAPSPAMTRASRYRGVYPCAYSSDESASYAIVLLPCVISFGSRWSATTGPLPCSRRALGQAPVRPPAVRLR